MRIDYDLLVTQRDFLLEYPWRDNTDLPEEVDGLINLLDALIDEGVDAMERTPAISSQASTSGRCATCSVDGHPVCWTDTPDPACQCCQQTVDNSAN